MKTKQFISGLAFMAVTALASAQGPAAGQGPQGGNGQGNGQGMGRAYADADKNGICDNFENNASRPAGARCGNGRYAQDQKPGMGQGQGCGQQGQGQGQGRGRGRNFVDNDKNGVCDIYEKSVKK